MFQTFAYLLKNIEQYAGFFFFKVITFVYIVSVPFKHASLQNNTLNTSMGGAKI
jgi:uncharacterized membrane protein YccF (DUF307 family)